MNLPCSSLKAGTVALGLLFVLSLATAAPAPSPRQPRLQGSIKVDRIWSGNQALPPDLAFTPDGKKLFSVDGNSVAKLWDVATGKQVAAFRGDGYPPEGRGNMLYVALSPDGKTIASNGIGRTIRFWDVGTGKQLGSLTQSKTSPNQLLYSREGKSLFAIGDNRGSSLWDLRTKKEQIVMKGLMTNDHDLLGVGFDPNGKPLVLTWRRGRNPSTELWTVDSGDKPAFSFEDNWGGVTLSADGKTIAVLFIRNNTVRMWDVLERKYTTTLQIRADKRNGLALSPDGKLLAVGYRDRRPKPVDEDDPPPPIPCWLVLYDVASGKELATLKGTPGPAPPFVFSPDGRTLATSDGGSNIQLWSLPDHYEERK